MPRLCARCHQQKSEFYRSNQSWCKECVLEWTRARRAASRPAREQIPEGLKRCACCRELRTLNSFRLRPDNGRPYAYCNDCVRQANERYRQAGVARRAAKARGPRKLLHGPRGPLGAQWASWRTTGRKRCPHCREEKPIAEFDWNKTLQRPNGWCRVCQLEAHKVWGRTPAGRAAQRRGAKKQHGTRKGAVRRFTRAAIDLGLLVRHPCEVCGEIEVHAHHVDYDNPLDVHWLCPVHHRDAHRRERLQ